MQVNAPVTWRLIFALQLRAYSRQLKHFIAVSGMAMLIIAVGSFLWKAGSAG